MLEILQFVYTHWILTIVFAWLGIIAIWGFGPLVRVTIERNERKKEE